MRAALPFPGIIDIFQLFEDFEIFTSLFIPLESLMFVNQPAAIDGFYIMYYSVTEICIILHIIFVDSCSNGSVLEFEVMNSF